MPPPSSPPPPALPPEPTQPPALSPGIPGALAAALEAQQRSELGDDARRTAFGLEQVQERLRALYALAGQRLALLSEDDEAGAAVTGEGERSRFASASASGLGLAGHPQPCACEWCGDAGGWRSFGCRQPGG